MITDSIILTGSYARGTQTFGSDIDFMFISENVNHFHTETTWDGDDETQIILIPRTKIHKMIMERSFDDNSLLISMLKSCKVISDQSGFANKLSKYVDNMKEAPNEHAVLAHISTLSNRCRDLRNTDDELEKALLASTIMILLAHILSYNFISGTKHCMRKLSRSHLRDEILNVYHQYTTHQDYSPLLAFASETIGNFKKDNLTTGLSLNNINRSSPIVVFFPKKSLSDYGMKKIVTRISYIFSDCNAHVFYHGPMQAMNEGTYVFIENKRIPAMEICRRIRSYDITVSKSRTELGIVMIYPYYTSFGEGAYFGGQDILLALSPIFSAFWNEYLIQISRHPASKFQEKYSVACGILLLSNIACLLRKQMTDISLFKKMIEILLPDVTDPEGVYNVEQTRYLRRTTISIFQEQYIASQGHITESIKAIANRQISDLESMYSIMDMLITILDTIDIENNLLYPDIYPFDNKSDVFFMELCFHVFSIFQMTQEQKFSVVFNMAASNDVCLDDFLSQDR